MIISDEHRLAFVHIPKCAGVSVKQPMRCIDSTEGFYSRIGDHPDLGRIHFAHIVLDDLADYFPEDFARVRAYRSFAVVRDPVDRFVSAMFQRLREFRSYDQSAITPQVFDREAQHVVDHLESAPPRLSLDYVHFNRQVDFLVHRGDRVVQDLFAIEDIAALTAYVKAHTGISVEEERRNRSTELRAGALKPVIRAIKAPYAALVPYAVRNRLRARLEKAGIYGDVAKQEMIAPGGRIDDFIRTYYADDFVLHASCR